MYRQQEGVFGATISRFSHLPRHYGHKRRFRCVQPKMNCPNCNHFINIQRAEEEPLSTEYASVEQTQVGYMIFVSLFVGFAVCVLLRLLLNPVQLYTTLLALALSNGCDATDLLLTLMNWKSPSITGFLDARPLFFYFTELLRVICPALAFFTCYVITAPRVAEVLASEYGPIDFVLKHLSCTRMVYAFCNRNKRKYL